MPVKPLQAGAQFFYTALRIAQVDCAQPPAASDIPHQRVIPP